MKKKFLKRDRRQTMTLSYSFDNPAGILALIRDGVVKDWESLCSYFQLIPFPVDTLKIKLLQTLESFLRIDYIEFYGYGDETQFSSINHSNKEIILKNITFKVTNKIYQLQSTLNISIKELSKLDTYSSFIVYPRFGIPKEIEIDILALMPLSDKFTQVYFKNIQEVSRRVGLSAKLADDFYSNDSIIDDIWNAINSAKIIIADCTSKNPNVFYEIGIAHVVGKPVILITNDKKDIPFDVGHIRYIEYEDNKNGMIAFEDKLEKAIKNIIEFDDIKYNEYLSTM